MNHQIEAERTVVAQGTGLSTSLANAKQELDSAQSVARRWEKAAPGKRDIPALFARIDALAKNANLTIGRFDPQPAVPHESFEEIPINMTCSGTFAQIYEFLRAVEGMPVTVWVESLRMEKTGKAVKGVKCELNLVVFSDNS
jgi:Tfp pilus assembly protein PilO